MSHKYVEGGSSYITFLLYRHGGWPKMQLTLWVPLFPFWLLKGWRCCDNMSLVQWPPSPCRSQLESLDTTGCHCWYPPPLLVLDINTPCAGGLQSDRSEWNKTNKQKAKEQRTKSPWTNDIKLKYKRFAGKTQGMTRWDKGMTHHLKQVYACPRIPNEDEGH